MSTCPACSNHCLTSARFCSSCGAALVGPSFPPTIEYVPPLQADGAVGAERFAPGQVLAGRYRVVALLGAGGMGEVYRADDLTLGQQVALKFPPRSLVADPDQLARFRAEVRSARQVTHPNVCRVHDIGEHQGQPFLIMEFIDGEDLASLLKRVGRLPEEKAIEVARQLTAALIAVHERGLLHRDLKPANVMLDGRGRVRLTDFGVAVLAHDAHDVGTGTPAYQAPEVLAGREVTVASDLFALGLVLYEIFTGRKAYSATTRGDLERAHAGGPPSKPSSHATGIDSGVERIILRCLANAPADRPRSAIEVLAALPGGDALQAALAAGQTPSPTLVADSGGTGRIPLWLGGLLLAAVVLGLLAFAALSDRASLHRLVTLRDPHYLRGKARDLLEQLGHPRQPVDWVEGYLIDPVAQEAALTASDPRRTLAMDRPAVLAYWYRHSPYRIVQRLSPNDISGYGVPGLPTVAEPDLAPGEVCVVLDGLGRLIEYHAQPGGPGTHDGPTDWSRFFQAAGLDPMAFDAVTPNRDPGARVSEWSAFEGDDPFRFGSRLRVERAGRDGRAVYFWVGDAAAPDTPDRSTIGAVPVEAEEQVSEFIYAAIRLLALTVGGWLAWWNVRRGQANLAGARLIALVFMGAFLGMWMTMGHHTPNLADEWATLTPAVGEAVLNALVLGIIYLALEPSVRRVRPSWLIGWNRLLAGRWSDPLVGRDVLVGCLIGVLWAILIPIQRTLLPEWLGQAIAPYSVWMPTLSLSPIGPILAYVWWALLFSLLNFFLLMLIYLPTRSLSLAVVLWALFKFGQWSGLFAGSAPIGMVILAGVLVALSLFTLLRFGLLVFVVFGFVRDLTTDLPVTLDWQAWYVTAGICTLAVVIGLAAFGFVTCATFGDDPDGTSVT